MIDHDKQRRAAARQARRARHRRGHDRHLQHRQRPAPEHLAGRRHDAVPQREEHQLGGRVPRPRADPLAGQDPGRGRVQRDRPAPRLAADVARRRRRHDRRREAQAGPRRSAARPTGCTSTATTCCPTSPARSTSRPRNGFVYFSDDGDVLAHALRQLEDRVHGAALPRHAAGLGRAVRAAARPEAVQSAHRPVRARRHDLEHLLRLDASTNAYLHPRRRAIVVELPRDVPGVPAAAEGGALHDRPGAGEAGDGAERTSGH